MKPIGSHTPFTYHPAVRHLRWLALLIATLVALSGCSLLAEEPGCGAIGAGLSTTDTCDGNQDPSVPEPGTPDPGTPDPGTPDPPDSDPTSPAPSMAAEMLAAVNAARVAGAQCGTEWRPAVALLTLSPLLVQAAQAHSEDQLAMKTMSHTGSDGSNPGQRISRTGYNWRTWGENVAWNQRSVQSVMSAWMNSPGHCRNIMNPNFTEFGAGEDGWFWTQVFAAPRN